jgi:DNA polymerase
MTQDTKISPEAALKWYDAMEIDHSIDPAKTPFDTKSEIEKIANKMDVPTAGPGIGQSGSRALADKASSIEELRSIVMNFDGCNLKKTALNTVFADGVTNAKFMLIGEAPGASEDEKGIPFCGASGNLLDNIISSIGMSRKENAYISNSVFWRPPANRRPTEEEIEICKPFVEKHIALIKPDLLILVGATAVSALLGKQLKISEIRQEYYDYSNKYLENSIKTTALFHPAYLLRQPGQKRAMWYDLLKIKAFIED